jgi:hypothetical protein
MPRLLQQFYAGKFIMNRCVLYKFMVVGLQSAVDKNGEAKVITEKHCSVDSSESSNSFQSKARLYEIALFSGTSVRRWFGDDVVGLLG